MDVTLPSDTAFEMFMATVTVNDLSEYEQSLYRHHRYEELKAS